jgi:uncharacterized membrane protein YhfC
MSCLFFCLQGTLLASFREESRARLQVLRQLMPPKPMQASSHAVFLFFLSLAGDPVGQLQGGEQSMAAGAAAAYASGRATLKVSSHAAVCPACLLVFSCLQGTLLASFREESRARLQVLRRLGHAHSQKAAGAVAAGADKSRKIRTKALSHAVVCPLQGTLLASFREESRARLQVLRRLGHVAADGTVLLKGRAACEIDTADELLTVGECCCYESVAPGFSLRQVRRDVKHVAQW